MIIGTAGHIDHGKTTLVKALTGVDADRLPEEKARGITIDLGYAYSPLPGGGVLGFVDVPGHERLVHNMLAGATGIDFVLLVVAADDGPMPQTREHLQIVELLGLTRGAVALTKIDVVDPERVREAAGEVSALLERSALAGAPLFPVSSLAGTGVPELRRHLDTIAASTPARRASGHFRLAIDRCFSLKGTGTVVTGTVHSGMVQTGDELMLSPPGVPVRVRSIHAQDRPVQVGSAGQRCALNLAGQEFDKDAVQRGQWVLHPAVHAPVQRIDVRLHLLSSEPRALRHWTPGHLHLGAADISARVALLEGDAVEPGASALAQLVLERPAGALVGDRFVVRDQSATRTVGGGKVLDPFPPPRGRRTVARLALLQAWESGDERVALRAALDQTALGVDLSRFTRAWDLRPKQALQLFHAASMRLIETGEGTFGFAPSGWQSLRERIVDALAAEHQRVPDMVGVGRERLRRLAAPALAPAAYEAALAELLSEGRVARNGAWLHRPDHQVRFTPADEKLWARVQPLLDETPFHPPRVRDLSRSLLIDEDAMRQLLKRAARLGRVYPVAHDHYFTQAAVAKLADIVRALAAESGTVTAAAFRDRIATGRKLAIQILEFFDRIGFTRRAKDSHVPRRVALFERESEPRPA